MAFFNWKKNFETGPESEGQEPKPGNAEPDPGDAYVGAPTPAPAPEPAGTDITFANYVNTFLGDVNSAGLDTQKDKEVIPFSTAATQQAVSMMGEDARSYLQGMELIYTAATAKGLEMVAEENPQGAKLLTQVATSQAATGTFSVAIAACAEAFAKL